jgi:hypothetical protein
MQNTGVKSIFRTGSISLKMKIPLSSRQRGIVMSIVGFNLIQILQELFT